LADVLSAEGVEIYANGLSADHDRPGLYFILSEIQESLNGALARLNGYDDNEAPDPADPDQGKGRTEKRDS